MHENVELPINFIFKCEASDYHLVVRPYLLGQHRIQLLKGSPDHDGISADIVRECCTYNRATAVKVKDAIIAAENPEAYMETFVKPWNCDGPGGRLRLDNTPISQIGPWPPWTEK